MLIDNRIEKDFNLSGEEIEIMQLIKSQAEDISIPMALEPDILKQRLPSKEKAPLWKVLSPVMAAAAACFAIAVVGIQSFVEQTPPVIIDVPSIVVPENVPTPEPVSVVEIASKEEEVYVPVKEESTVESTKETIKPEDISSSVPEEYKNLYIKVLELDSENSAQVKGVARASNFSDVFGGSSSLITTYQNDTDSQFDTVQFDGKYIYSVTDNNTVVINRVDGENFYTASEIFVDFGMDKDEKNFGNLHVTSCYVNQGRLLVLGQAEYNETDVVTALACYDISSPERPYLLSNSYQDGALLSSRISGGFAYLITRKSVVNPSEYDVQTYVPFYMTNHDYKTFDAEEIYMSDYAQSPCYIVASSVLLKEPYNFYDTVAVLGDSTEVYVDVNGIYLADNIYKDESPYTAIVKIDYGKGNFNEIKTASVFGRLVDSKSMDEYEDVIRVVTLHNNAYSLHTLDENLEALSSVDNITEGEKLYNVYFDKENIYLSLGKNRNKVYNLSDAYNPVCEYSDKIYDAFVETVSIGEYESFDVDYSENGLDLVLYSVISPKRVREINRVEVASGNIYTEAYDNQKSFLICGNLVGFSYCKYDGEDGSYYVIYKVSEESIEKVMEYRYPSRVYEQKAYIKGDTIYVTSPSSVAVLDVNSGRVIWETEF